MTSTRQAATAPELPGFHYVSVLGTGGYADVFLYEQARPRRQVAVKVLLAAGLTESRRAQFTAEADLMAQVSAHPYIVNIFDADVAADGRPYLVMEYYPRPHLGVRAKNERLSVPEVLRMGIQIAGAVESAHRLGILHRDIKPANILTSQYGRPGLTDFGISAAIDGPVYDDDRGGMSIPWSAPEVFRPAVEPDERSDVYGLAATVWHLLAGRSPFDATGGDNRPLAMMRRIETDVVAETGRDDVPASLERALHQGMRKNPAGRFVSAYDFARALQAVQLELSLGVSPIEVPEGDVALPRGRQESPALDADATRFKPVRVDAAAPPPPLPAKPAAADAVPVQEKRSANPRRIALGVAAGLALGVVAVLAYLLVAGGAPPAGDEPTRPPVAQDVTAGAFVSPVEGSARRVSADVVAFSWSTQDPKPGDFFLVTRTDTGPGPHPTNVRQDKASYEIRGVGGGRPCIDVVVVRATGQASEPTGFCAND